MIASPTRFTCYTFSQKELTRANNASLQDIDRPCGMGRLIGVKDKQFSPREEEAMVRVGKVRRAIMIIGFDHERPYLWYRTAHLKWNE